MDWADVIYLCFLAICAWLAIHWDEGGGGGKRSRVPLAR
jgi:hypothetical protein